MSGVTFKLEGIGAALGAFEELAVEIGDKKANSEVLKKAARASMQPVLDAARMNAPVDTGLLKLVLQLETRRPTRRDKRSKYVTETDSVIAVVTTASGLKIKSMSEGIRLQRARTRLTKYGVSEEKAAKLTKFNSDARAIAQEFGTASNPAQPYLRPALESQAQATVSRLSEEIKKYIDRFRAKT